LRKENLLKKLWEYAQVLVVALVLALVLKATVVEAFVVPTSSMEPTIQIGDRFFSNKVTYRFHPPRSGDIVIFAPPSSATENQDIPFVKRVIGVEGDLIEIRDGNLYLNDRTMEEKYIKETPRYHYGPMKVPKDSLFVLGDNRNNSHDSHAWGFVPVKNVKARAMLRFWPLNRIGFIS